MFVKGFKVQRPTLVSVLLGQTDKEDFDCIGCYIVNTNGEHRVSTIRNNEIIGKTEFSLTKEGAYEYLLAGV